MVIVNQKINLRSDLHPTSTHLAIRWNKENCGKMEMKDNDFQRVKIDRGSEVDMYRNPLLVYEYVHFEEVDFEAGYHSIQLDYFQSKILIHHKIE
jgi:hypothetical protein